MADKTLDAFKNALDVLIDANPHARSKGDEFKNWIKEHFGCDARISYIKEQRQITNRVSEQFRYFAPIVVFVCVSEVKRETLIRYILERDYKQLESVAIIGITTANGQKQYSFEHLITFTSSDFIEWIKPNFSKTESANSLKTELGIPLNDGYAETTPVEGVVSKTTKHNICFDTGYESAFSRNRILFGAPGTGKSFTLNKECKKLLANGGEYERVTFHPDYSYANFVGTYKPVMVSSTPEFENGSNAEVIALLTDKTKTAQEKYDLLYDKFKDEGLTRLPILLGLYTDETFKTRKQDGTDAVGDNSVERNHGKALRPYVTLANDVRAKSEIAYEYVPGPFMRMLVKALKNAMTNNHKPHVLVIEEINRANVAAVFGDVFQLLDRAENNSSEYEIATTNDMRDYLATELGVDRSEVETIRIPDNMFIWATMNSADQGVFPMDTAFKRRWDFTYLGIDNSEDKISGKTVVLGTGEYRRKVEWNELRKAINSELLGYKVNEDKLMGAFFISKKNIPEGDTFDPVAFSRIFKNKVIMYLFDDAAKQKRISLFGGCEEKFKNQYSKICNEFDTKGVFVFCEAISSQFIDDAPEDEE